MILAIVFAALVSGCSVLGQDEATLGAQTVIAGGLKSPGSYTPVLTEKLWEGKTSSGHNAYVVRTVFDAQNAFGALLRDCRLTAFYIEGDRVMHSMLGSLKCEINAPPGTYSELASQMSDALKKA